MADGVNTVHLVQVDLRNIEDKILKRLEHPEAEYQEGTNTVSVLAPATNTQTTAEVQYALDKILKNDGKKPQKLVEQKDLNDLLNDESMTEPQSFETVVVEPQKPEVTQPNPILNKPQTAKTVEQTKAELNELEALRFDEPIKPKKETKKTPSEVSKNKTPKIAQKRTKKPVSKPAIKTAAKPVSKKPPKIEEKISLLDDLLAEAEAIKTPPKEEVIVNKFDARADKAVRGMGNAIISPFKALTGIKDIVTGDFDNGHKEIRNAVADFANAPAQAANFATTFASVIIDDFAGETAEKIITAPAKAVSGIWETGVAIVKPEEGSVKKAFNKMTFGIFN